MTSEQQVSDQRRERSRRSRAAMAAAALDLLLEDGLPAVTVEEIAARAGVTRRTFSRHFVDRADAVLDHIRSDGHRINRALRERPADESLLTAYDRATALGFRDIAPGVDWVRRHALFRAVDLEPTLFAAYQRIRVDAQEESVRILAERIGVDPDVDPRPAVAVGIGAGTLTAALTAWGRGNDPTSLPAVLRTYFDSLGALLPPEPHIIHRTSGRDESS